MEYIGVGKAVLLCTVRVQTNRSNSNVIKGVGSYVVGLKSSRARQPVNQVSENAFRLLKQSNRESHNPAFFSCLA
jgi:hypothetical protein